MTAELVCIVGPDGAGKSTQVELLCAAFEEQNVPAEHRWLGFRHVLSLPLLFVSRLLGLSEVRTLADDTEVGYHYFWRSRVISTLYPVVLLLDTILFVAPIAYHHRYLTNRVVVCDRYVFDILVDAMISVRDYDLHRSLVGRVFRVLVPAGTETILLTANAETLQQRRADVRHDRTLETKVTLFDRLADEYDLTTVDAAQSIEAVHTEILAATGRNPPNS